MNRDKKTPWNWILLAVSFPVQSAAQPGGGRRVRLQRLLRQQLHPDVHWPEHQDQSHRARQQVLHLRHSRPLFQRHEARGQRCRFHNTEFAVVALGNGSASFRLVVWFSFVWEQREQRICGRASAAWWAGACGTRGGRGLGERQCRAVYLCAYSTLSLCGIAYVWRMGIIKLA